VLHLHGSLFAARCAACGHPHSLPQILDDAPPVEQERLTPPRCERCNGYIRPGVVWFGENLPQDVVRQATALLKACDLLLIVGTSGVVYPAAGMVELAPASATIIEINPDMSVEVQSGRRLHWVTTAAKALPVIATELNVKHGSF
jgi:NAD-dependent deacetylase